MSTTSLILTHLGAATVIYAAFIINLVKFLGRAPRPRESPAKGLMALEGVVAGSEPEILAPFSRRACVVAWRILTPGNETQWKSGPSDWAEAILVRLDNGQEVRLAFTDVTLVSGLPCVGPVQEPLSFGGRPAKVGQYDEWTGRVREESIAVGDRVYVSGEFSSSSPKLGDPMRREGDTEGGRRWSVSRPPGKLQARLHRGTFADFGVFGSQSRRYYRLALMPAIPTFGLYLGFAAMAFGRLW